MKLKLKGARAGKAKAGFGNPLDGSEFVVEMWDGAFDIADADGKLLLATMPSAFEVLDVPVAPPPPPAPEVVPEVAVAEDVPVKRHKK